MHDGRMFSGRLTLSAVFYTPEGDGRAAAAAAAVLAFRVKVQTKKNSMKEGEYVAFSMK